jgi:hypothetical protein
VASRELTAALVVAFVVFAEGREGQVAAVFQFLGVFAFVNVQLVLAVLDRGAVFVHQADEREAEQFLVVFLSRCRKKNHNRLRGFLGLEI